MEKQAPASFNRTGVLYDQFKAYLRLNQTKQILERFIITLTVQGCIIKPYNLKLNHIVMKDQDLRQDQKQQGNPTSDRAHNEVKNDKKQNGITNGGGQRSDQTSNKDNQRKRGE